MKTTIPRAEKPAGHSGKPVCGIPFAITSATGEKLLESLVIIVPDGQASAPKGLIPGLPEPLMIERCKWACLVREWRRNPDTPRDRRNFPTVGEVLMAAVRRQLFATLTSSPS